MTKQLITKLLSLYVKFKNNFRYYFASEIKSNFRNKNQLQKIKVPSEMKSNFGEKKNPEMKPNSRKGKLRDESNFKH